MNNRRSFIIGIKSTKLSKKEKIFLRLYKPWGVILFSRNIKSINQTSDLTLSIRRIFNDNKYPILIDQEGGRVNRLEKIVSFENLTSEFFGKIYLKNYREFKFFYKLFIDKTSFLLKSIGANINTSPVLDLRIKGSSNIIGDRSFSRNPNVVSKIGDFCIQNFHENGIGTVIKHIPGHGLAKTDSHFFTPVVNMKQIHLMKKDFAAFKNKKSFFAMTAHIIFKNIDSINTVTHSKKMVQLIRNQIKFKKSFFAMTAHIIFKNIDSINTVTHSKKMIKLIRKKIGFKNILISDDLSMKSLKGNIKENTIKTFNAGCNLALHCNGNIKEMEIVGKNSPKIDKFISKKTSQFYKILS